MTGLLAAMITLEAQAAGDGSVGDGVGQIVPEWANSWDQNREIGCMMQ
jgi:hypothetical protein